ncbi:MAG: bifunctional transaldolase/phosoglucose isomerase [Anaerolineae bacterium]|nr:bifunctional transaldolase/phosoglucose isomerase [Anaerolineae bacterium]MDW8098504.1 bifunctional transaldolase/phosoglucose isomerase [Anaerolineae bacterium]
MKSENPLRQLQAFGQSVWYDNIRRGLITSGELQQLMEMGIVGVTSNPTIFQRAIAGSTDYDDALRELALAGHSAQEIYEALAIEDIRAVADLLAPIYERTNGWDGYVSIEVSPELAYDTQGTVEEARRLRAAIGRHNVMIKVPATPAGIPAIEQLIADGVNINVTLIFALSAYEQVVNAYLAGLERRAQAGQPLANVTSVASVFVSRIDTAIDALLEERLQRTADPSERAEIQALLGKAAIANSKIIYRRFQQLFRSPRFQALMERGARVQRPLWASTSTKNPAYRDVMYVEELIGPDTVNTMPPVTIQAFSDHGVVRQTVTEGVDEAEIVLERLARLGIDLDAVMQRLLDEGVKAFADSFHALMDSIEAKRRAVLANRRRPWAASLGALQAAVDTRLEVMAQDRMIARLWAKDTSLWKEDLAHQAVIRNRLGWLRVTEEMQPHVAELQALAQEVWDEGFRHVMLLGMGGSSLCVEVFRRVYGSQPGAPTLWVLDTTHPDVIRKFEEAVDLSHTLFIVASKSGTTTEVVAFAAYFFDRVKAVRGDGAGQQFIAITDPGTPLAASAEARGFRRVVLNPPDIGGRYSGLSFFGLVPAALAGIDIARLLAQGDAMAKACQPAVPIRENPGAWLGAILGEAALAGRDKVTILAPPLLESFGLWAEQLIAESTGKEGKGIVPIAQEPVGSPEVYGQDRLFVYLTLDGEDRLDAAVAALEAAGYPVVWLRMPDISWIGAEFYRWEMATALAGAILGINPFDEPNVQESKDNTRRALNLYVAEGRLSQEMPAWEADGVAFFGERGSARSWEEALRAHLRGVRPGGYIAWMAYLDSTGPYEEALQAIRTRVRNALRVATTVGYGPRFLHSTGQLHKGGPDHGVFVQLTADPMTDLPIPGQPYSFGTLIAAQALGDWQSLRAHGRRVVRLHLGRDVAAGLASIQRALDELI